MVLSCEKVEGSVSDSRQFLTIENHLKMMKNAVYFMLKTFFVLKFFTFLSWVFDYVEKRLGKKAIVNLKLYEITVWIRNNWGTYITQYFTR